MKRNTMISTNLEHKTKLIDPRSGRVLKEGSTPMATVGEFKLNPTPQVPEMSREDLKAELKAEILAELKDK